MRRGRLAFTLIEVMAVVLVMALLTGAAAWSFSRPLQAARASDAVELIKAFDASSRLYARRFGRHVEMVFDLTEQALARREGEGEDNVRYRATMPRGCRIEQIRTGERTYDVGEVVIVCSPLALSRSYAVQIVGPGIDRWLVVAGLSGQVTQARNEAEVDDILNLASPRRDAH